MATAPPGWLKRVLRAANGAHVALYRRSGGKWANRIANLPVLLITTYGRKTGMPHTNAVVYIEDGPGYLVSATNGGSDWLPGWYRNLKARPDATIEIGNNALQVRAEFIDGVERTRLYEKFKAASGNFGKYEQKASHVLPVIRLMPVASRSEKP